MGRGLFPEPRVDSGWAWVVCFASFMLQFLTYGLSNAYATMFVAFLQEFKQGEAKTAWIGSTVIGLNFLLGPFSTALCDRWGCRSVALISSLFLFSALVTTSFVTQFTLLYITYGLCLGVASSLGYATSVIVLTKYFKKHLSLATGIGMAGAGLGTMTITSGASIVIAKYGWRFAFRCMSAGSVVVFVCGLSFVPFKKCPKELEVKKKFLQTAAPRRLLRGTLKLFYDPLVWKNRAFAVWSLAIALIFFANFAPFIFLTRMATDIGVPSSEAALLPGYLTLAQSFGKLLFGKLADFDQVNRISLYQAVLFVQGIATTLCPLASKYWAIVMYTVIFGLTDGCFGLMLGLGTHDVAGPEMMTRAFGCMSAVVALPLMTGPVVTGLIYDMTGTYSTGFFVGGGVTIAGVSLMFLIPLLMSEKDMEIKEEIEMNNKKTKEAMSSDATQKQCLITDDENRLAGMLSAKNELLQEYSSRSRPSSFIFLSAFPSLALSSNFLQEASLEESERELREDLHISTLLKRINFEIDRYEEVHLFRNRSEDLADKIEADCTEEDTSGIGLGSSSSLKSLSNLSSDRLSKQSTDPYQCACSTDSEEGVVLSEDEISLSWDCFSELVEEKLEQSGNIKPHFPLLQNGYDCFSQLMEEQLSNACSCSCSLATLDSTSCESDKELPNRTVGRSELSGYYQAFAPETKL